MICTRGVKGFHREKNGKRVAALVERGTFFPGQGTRTNVRRSASACTPRMSRQLTDRGHSAAFLFCAPACGSECDASRRTTSTSILTGSDPPWERLETFDSVTAVLTRHIHTCIIPVKYRFIRILHGTFFNIGEQVGVHKALFALTAAVCRGFCVLCMCANAFAHVPSIWVCIICTTGYACMYSMYVLLRSKPHSGCSVFCLVWLWLFFETRATRGSTHATHTSPKHPHNDWLHRSLFLYLTSIRTKRPAWCYCCCCCCTIPTSTGACCGLIIPIHFARQDKKVPGIVLFSYLSHFFVHCSRRKMVRSRRSHVTEHTYNIHPIDREAQNTHTSTSRKSFVCDSHVVLFFFCIICYYYYYYSCVVSKQASKQVPTTQSQAN